MIADSDFFEFSGERFFRNEKGRIRPFSTSMEDEIISDLQTKKFKFDASTGEEFVERVSDHVSEQKCKNTLMKLSSTTFISSSLNSVICKIDNLSLYWGQSMKNVFVGLRNISAIYRERKLGRKRLNLSCHQVFMSVGKL